MKFPPQKFGNVEVIGTKENLNDKTWCGRKKYNLQNCAWKITDTENNFQKVKWNVLIPSM